MTTARSVQVDPEITPYYHCVSRCVRGAFLLGDDAASRQNYDHRKEWVVEELARLERIFAVDVCAYAVMSNHVHSVLRLDVSAARTWTDQELTSRARQLFPLAVRGAEEAGCLDERLPVYRERLCSLSWFMRCFNERIARRANREDGCQGRFWEGRFKVRPLLDAGALLTCMAYVDLNPVRAGRAESLAESDFSSIQARLAAHGRQVSAPTGATVHVGRAGKLPVAPRLLPFVGETPARQGEDRAPAVVLPFSLPDYVELVRFSGEAVRGDKRGALPPSIATRVRGLGLRDEAWGASLRSYGALRFAALGERHLMDAEVERRGLLRASGASWVRLAYGGTSRPGLRDVSALTDPEQSPAADAA